MCGKEGVDFVRYNIKYCTLFYHSNAVQRQYVGMLQSYGSDFILCYELC